MNIHLLPHKTANHNIFATKLLVEVTNMKKEHKYLPWCTWGQFRTFGDSAILKSSLLNGIAHSLGHQHGVPRWDGGANGYHTALPQVANPQQGTVMRIPFWRPASVPALLYEWTNIWTGNFSWEANNAAGLKSVPSLFWQERLTHICQHSAMPLQCRLKAQIGIKMRLLRGGLLLFCVDTVSALRFIQLNVWSSPELIFRER